MIGIKKETEKLFKDFGKIKITENNQLKDYFILDGIDYWDLVAPIICYHYLPALINETKVPYLRRYCRATLAYFKFVSKLVIGKYSKRVTVKIPKEKSVDVKILFLNFSPYMSKEVLLPISQCLSEVPGCEKSSYFLADFFSFKKETSSQNIVDMYCDDLYGGYSPYIASLTKEIKKRASTVIPEIKKSEVFSGKNFLRSNINFMISWIFSYHIPKLVYYVEAAKRVLKDNSFNSVVSADFSDPRSRVFIAVANQIGIQTLDIQFGLLDIDDCNFEWGLCRSLKISVWGEKSRLELMKAGVISDRIYVTGSPKHDYIYTQKMSDSNNHTVLFASTHEPLPGLDTTNPKPIRDVKVGIRKLIEEFPEIIFLIKPHPLEDEVYLRNLFSGLRNAILINKKELA
jgi:hypothetical protein